MELWNSKGIRVESCIIERRTNLAVRICGFSRERNSYIN